MKMHDGNILLHLILWSISGSGSGYDTIKVNWGMGNPLALTVISFVVPMKLFQIPNIATNPKLRLAICSDSSNNLINIKIFST